MVHRPLTRKLLLSDAFISTLDNHGFHVKTFKMRNYKLYCNDPYMQSCVYLNETHKTID